MSRGDAVEARPDGRDAGTESTSGRRLPLVAVAVVTVACVIGVTVLAVAAGGQAIAYRVNGADVSQATIDGQLDDLANAKATSKASTTPGAVDARATAQVLNLNIARDVMQGVADRRGVSVSSADRKAARQSIESELPGYPASYVNLVTDVGALSTALGLGSVDEQNAFVSRAFRRADVYINPRYGTWHGARGACPPTGCASLSAGSGG